MKRRNTVAAGEQGFTLVEAMTAIALICACTIIIGAFLSAALKTTGKIRDTLSAAAALLRADEELRRYTAAITIPYWERHANILYTPDRTVIPWYEGRADKALEIVKTEDSFSVNVIGVDGTYETSASTSLALRLPALKSVDLLKDEDGNPFGFDAVWEYRGGNSRTICRFSSSVPAFAGYKKEQLQ